MPLLRHVLSVLVPVLLLAATPLLASDINYESPPVHPVELSPSGNMLFVTHMADHRLVAYDVQGPAVLKVRDIMVGLEPVTVRARTDGEVWVVNHVSDSISIIDVSEGTIIRTLIVGDEPTDVVFADGKAFVCLSQEDRIKVYDLGDLTAAPTIIDIDGSDPRSLAVSNDGQTVYVNVLDSGNRTTVVPRGTVSANGGLPAPTPPMNGALPPAPDVSLIVQFNGTNWLDETGGNWNAHIPYNMPDEDVFAIDVTSLSVTSTISGVGTSLFNLAVHPTSGDLYVTNTEAFNLVRFEPKLKSGFAQNRITRIVPGSSVTPVHLNTHINYADTAGTVAERALSLSTPLDLAIDSSGTDIYVVAYGSSKVGVLDVNGAVTRRIDVGEGPAGLALDETNNRLYVYNRFMSTLSVVDLTDDSSIELSLGFDPTPTNIRDGRKFLYDGELTSAHGDLSCGTCHIFGGFDGIAWDLGDPTLGFMLPGPPGSADLHPMKGPFTTQSLKGLSGTEPLHWRGDRAVFATFNPAFVDLLGRGTFLSGPDMQLFQDFIFGINYPSNPHRNLDNSLASSLNGANPITGESLFQSGGLFGGAQCVNCHALPLGTNNAGIPAAAIMDAEGKVVPHLRNLYEKTGFDNASANTIRGFGFTADGEEPEIFSFLQFPLFSFNNDTERRDVEAFLLSFDTGTHPAIGAQWTMDGTNQAAGIGRVNTLEAEADLGLIGLVAKANTGTEIVGYTYIGSGLYDPDRDLDPDVSQATLLAAAGVGTEVTFTGVPLGCETRLGTDRDGDGHLDGDERDAGSDPANPASTPVTITGVGDTPTRAPLALWIAGANPVTGGSTRLGFTVGNQGPVQMAVYDVKGRLVQELVNDTNHAIGNHTANWNLRNRKGQRVSSGIYFVRLKSGREVQTHRLTIIR